MKDYEIVSKLKKVKLNHNRVGEGEVTGHSHRCSGDVDIYTDIDSDNSDRLLEVKTPTILTHEEHGEINLGVGCYIVTTQRTVSLEQEVRKVKD